MRKFLFFFCSLIIISSCTDTVEGASKPDNLIPKDTMVMILKDMTLIESFIQTKYMHVSSFEKTMKLSGKKILDKYHVSYKRYDESMDYYGSRQEQMEAIYAQILDSLNRQASKFDKDLLQKDSINQNALPGVLNVKPLK